MNYKYKPSEIYQLTNINRSKLRWLRECGLTYKKFGYNKFLYDLDEVNFKIKQIYKDNTLLIVKDFINGLSTKEIRNKYNISNPTVINILKNANVYENRYIVFDEKDQNDIINDYIFGLPPFILREKYNISSTHLKRILNKFKVKKQNYTKCFKYLWKTFLSNEEFEERWQEYLEKQSKCNSGEKNYWYGKPPPNKTGNGWRGWYNGWFFRSLRELSYMVDFIEKNNLTWESGESSKFKIEYLDFNNKKRNYFPDFIINNEKMVEIKPKSLHNSDIVNRKKIAAIEFCRQNNLEYNLIDYPVLSFEKINSMFEDKKIIFIENTLERFMKYRIFNNSNK